MAALLLEAQRIQAAAFSRDHDIRTRAGELPPTAEDPLVELESVEEEVQRVAETLANLLKKAHNLKTRINQIYSPLIRLLPAEIISEIFISCLPVQNLGDDVKTQDTSAPLRLGAICSAWRRIAWGTPLLWSTAVLHLTSAPKIQAQASLLQQWLKRSGSLPLSIRLSSAEDVSWIGISPEDIMTTVGAHVLRWRELDIRLPSACYRHLPRADEKQTFPMLRSLTLKPPGGQGDRVHRINIVNSPELTHLTLTCLYLRSINFQWEVLTNLNLESFYIDETLDMLRQTPKLVEFTVSRILGGDDRHPVPDEPITLPGLVNMSITNDKGADLQVLLDKITTPSLRNLSYTGDGVIPTTELVALLTRSACVLDTLSISDSFLRENNLDLILSAVPSLKEFTLKMPIPPSSHSTSANYAPLTDEILQKCDPAYIRANQDSPAVCLIPNLEVLTYTGVQVFSWPYFTQMIHSRTRVATSSGSHLREVNLTVVLFTAQQAASVPMEKELHLGSEIKVSLKKILQLPESVPEITTDEEP